MDFSRPLSTVTSSVDGDVLAHLGVTDAWFTTGRLHRALGRHSEDGVRRALRRLVHQGIVLDERGGNATLYRLNRSHLAAPAVEQLAGLWGTFLGRTAEQIRGWTVVPKLAAVFGSAARGAMTSDSDIDLLVVRPAGPFDDAAWTNDVHRLERDASSWTGNDVRVLELAETHVLEHAGDEPVLHDVASEGVALCGDLDWLRRLVALDRVGRVS